MLLGTHKILDQSAPVLLTVHPVPLNLLVTAIIVNQVTKTELGQMIHYGMFSCANQNLPAALVPTLPHGSVYSYLLQQLMQLK